MNFNQQSFAGGLDTINHDSKIAPDAYPWLFNGRNRFGKIDPIPKHIKITNAPTGLKQGIIAVGNIIVLFVAGKAYYQQFGDLFWTNIGAFSMDPNVDRYYTLAVPASYMNFVRKAGASINAPMIFSTDFKLNGTPAAIIVQDTINQPWLIIFDTVNQIFIARVSQNFSEWDNQSADGSDREYIPIGRQMFYLNGKTFIVARDGFSVYQSITGRPLDFMMNVDVNGNKAATEALGGADTTSFAQDFNEITCVLPVSTPDSFVYATAHTVRILTMDYNNTIFGEPTYTVSASISAGVVNQDSWVELVGIGDYAFVDFEGIISFNAVQTFRFNGRNSLFSLPLQLILHNIKQTNPCVTFFQNYAIFNIDTQYGNVMAIYDVMRNQNSLASVMQKEWISADIQSNRWTAIDITDITEVKQFAIVETVNASYLFCINRHDEVWNLFASTTDVYPVTLQTRGHTETETDMEHKSWYFRPFFQSEDIGICALTELVDGLFSNYIEQPLISGIGGVNYPVRPPIIPNTINQVDNPAYCLKDGLMGKKINFILTWNINASLIEYNFKSSSKQGLSSQKQSANVLSS